MMSRLVLAGLIGSALAASSPVVFSDSGVRDGYSRTAVADGSAAVRFTISVKQRNTAELKRRALEVSTPGGPRYGQYMSQAEIDALTAPKQSDVQAVTSWLNEAGVSFTVSRELVHVTTSVDAAEALLATTFVSYSQPGRDVPLLRATTYSLPEAVAAATATVFGLHGMPLPLGHRVAVRSHAPNAAGDTEFPAFPPPPPPVVKVTPAVLEAKYNFSGAFVNRSIGNSNRQAVAEFQGELMKKEDVTRFFKNEVPSAQAGDDQVSKFVGAPYEGGDGVEADLDIQFLMGVSPGVKTEFWEFPGRDFCADMHNYTDMLLADDNNTPASNSISYGWQGDLGQLKCQDADVQAVDVNFAKLAAKGISIMISSGDSGSAYNPETCADENIKQGLTVVEGTSEQTSEKMPRGTCCAYASQTSPLRPKPRSWTWVEVPPTDGLASPSAAIKFDHAPFHVDRSSGGCTKDFPKRDLWVLDGKINVKKGGSVSVHNVNGTFADTTITFELSAPKSITSGSYNLTATLNSVTYHGVAECFPGSSIGCSTLYWHTGDVKHPSTLGQASLSMGYNPRPPPPEGNCSFYTKVTKTGPAGPGTYSGGPDIVAAKPTFYPSWPASSPWVTAVGATRFVDQKVDVTLTLTLTLALTLTLTLIRKVGGDEMATDQFGSGGGFSKRFNQSDAPWQVDAVAAYVKQGPSLPKFPPAGSFPTNGRATPDVSALGEGYQVYVNGKVESVGGTSASSPMFAGLVSLLNEARQQAGKPRMGFLNPFLYANAHAFFDVTQGTNAIPRGPGELKYGFAAAKGWDAATGLGTPKFDKLLAAALAV